MSVQRLLALPIALLTLALVPGSASAAVRISFSAGVIAIEGDDDANILYETSFDDATPWFTTPAGSTLIAGPGCTQLATTGVECPGVGPGTRAEIDLGGGDDLFLWNGTTVPLRIDGGSGDDELSGGQAADVIDGGPGNDSIVGFGGNDRLDGGSGNDEVDGSSGDDRVDGGPGADKLHGDGEGDGDIAAQPFGNDTLIAQDGVRDEVDCDAGTDLAIADLTDQVARCEDISYPQTDSPAAPKSSSGSGGGAPAVTRAANSTLTLTLRRGALPRIGQFARGRGVRVTISATGTCTAIPNLRVGASQARSLRLGARRIVGTGRTVTVSEKASRTQVLKGDPVLRSRLRKAKKATVTLSVRCDPPGGDPVTARLSLRLRR